MGSGDTPERSAFLACSSINRHDYQDASCSSKGHLLHYPFLDQGQTLGQLIWRFGLHTARLFLIRAESLISYTTRDAFFRAFPTWCKRRVYHWRHWYQRKDNTPNKQLPSVSDDTVILTQVANKCQEHIDRAVENMAKFYSDDIQREIIIQMSSDFSRGEKGRAAQLWVYYNLIPELLIGDRQQAIRLCGEAFKLRTDLECINRKKEKLSLGNTTNAQSTIKEKYTLCNKQSCHPINDEWERHQNTTEEKVSNGDVLAWNCEVENCIWPLARSLNEVGILYQQYLTQILYISSYTESQISKLNYWLAELSKKDNQMERKKSWVWVSYQICHNTTRQPSERHLRGRPTPLPCPQDGYEAQARHEIQRNQPISHNTSRAREKPDDS